MQTCEYTKAVWRAPPYHKEVHNFFQQSHKDVREWALLLCRCIALYKRPRDRRKLFIKAVHKQHNILLYMKKFECGQGTTNQLWPQQRQRQNHVVFTFNTSSCQAHAIGCEIECNIMRWKKIATELCLFFPCKRIKHIFMFLFPNKQSAHAVFFFLYLQSSWKTLPGDHYSRFSHL